MFGAVGDHQCFEYFNSVFGFASFTRKCIAHQLNVGVKVEGFTLASFTYKKQIIQRNGLKNPVLKLALHAKKAISYNGSFRMKNTRKHFAS